MKSKPVKEKVKELLNSEGGALNGQTVLVTGTLPKLGHKNLIRLIENYGGELLKELRKTTSLVVVGDDLGSKKWVDLSLFVLWVILS